MFIWMDKNFDTLNELKNILKEFYLGERYIYLRNNDVVFVSKYSFTFTLYFTTKVHLPDKETNRFFQNILKTDKRDKTTTNSSAN